MDMYEKMLAGNMLEKMMEERQEEMRLTSLRKEFDRLILKLGKWKRNYNTAKKEGADVKKAFSAKQIEIIEEHIKWFCF